MTRREFVMKPAQLDKLLDACKAVPAMYLSGGRLMGPSSQENANAAWKALGREMGFDGATVKPIAGRGEAWFSAEEASLEQIASWQRTDISGRVVQVTVSVPSAQVDESAKSHVDETAKLHSSTTTDLFDSQLRELCAALGWQGGTYQQILAAVKHQRAALDQIAERTGSDDPCRQLVQIARDALRRREGSALDPNCAWPFPTPMPAITAADVPY